MTRESAGWPDKSLCEFSCLATSSTDMGLTGSSLRVCAHSHGRADTRVTEKALDLCTATGAEGLRAGV